MKCTRVEDLGLRGYLDPCIHVCLYEYCAWPTIYVCIVGMGKYRRLVCCRYTLVSMRIA